MVGFALCCAATIALGAFAAPKVKAADCPNEAIREAQVSEPLLPEGAVHFPACMALEMVSPPKKLGQETFTLSAFSADGSRALFVSKAALAGTEGLLSFGGDNYVASRGERGWTTAPTSPPRAAKISGGGATHGGPYAFAPGLGAWVLFGATQPQRIAGEGQVFMGALGGAFSSLSPPLAPIDDSGTADIILFASKFVGSGTATDLSATVFPTSLASTAYWAEDPRSTGATEPGGDTNSYLAFIDSTGKPALELLARDKDDVVYGGRCGSRLGGGGGLNQGAISPDGSRIYFSTRPAQPPSVGTGGPPCNTSNPLRILKRVQGGDGPEITELISCCPSAGNDLYQGASQDGTKVFLATPRKLAASDQDAPAEPCSSTVGASKGCDLYVYDSDLLPGDPLVQVSAGGTGDPEPGKGANVLSSIAAISPDGSHAYFAAQGVLTTAANPEGAVAVDGKPNLYLYQRDAANPAGRTAFIGTLGEGDKEEVWGSGKSFAAGAYAVPLLGGGEGGDGHTILLRSKASLTANDADGGRIDVFRYESEAPALQCVSCASGPPDAAPFDAFAGSTEVMLGPNFAEQGRWVSEDGRTVAFATAEALVAGDEDGAINPYLWQEGQLARLPSQVTGEVRPYKLATVSPGGEQVGFTTTGPLLPQDIDTARDAYLVRVDGGFPNPPPPPTPCDPLTEGACQGPPSVPLGAPSPASNSFSGPGNPAEPVKCRKGFVRKQGKCVKKPQKRKGKKHEKRASHKRGDSR
jgi:hypothetical protein